MYYKGILLIQSLFQKIQYSVNSKFHYLFQKDAKIQNNHASKITYKSWILINSRKIKKYKASRISLQKSRDTIIEDSSMHDTNGWAVELSTIDRSRRRIPRCPSDHRRIKILLTLSNDRNEISARAETRHLFPSSGDR